MFDFLHWARTEFESVASCHCHTLTSDFALLFQAATAWQLQVLPQRNFQDRDPTHFMPLCPDLTSASCVKAGSTLQAKLIPSALFPNPTTRSIVRSQRNPLSTVTPPSTSRSAPNLNFSCLAPPLT